MDERRGHHELLKQICNIRQLQQGRDEREAVQKRQAVICADDIVRTKEQIVDQGIDQRERQLERGPFQSHSLLQWQFWLSHSLDEVRDAQDALKEAEDEEADANNQLAKSIGYHKSISELIIQSHRNINKLQDRYAERKYEDLTSYRHWQNEDNA
ncbi:MAG: hypothetical protein HC843_11045 [Sphingomonadales bacterium]|nr:hypothetical protein [Sphingomonadales bacterium]